MRGWTYSNRLTQPYAWGSHTAIAELQGRPAPTAAARGGAVDGRAPVGAVRRAARRRQDHARHGDRRGPATRARRRVRRAVRRPAAVPAEGPGRRQGAVHPGAPVTGAGRGRVPGGEPSAASRRATSRATTSTTGPSRRSSARSPGSRCWPACGPRRTPPRCSAPSRVRELDPLAADLAAHRRTGPAALTGALGAILTWPAEGRGALVAAVTAGCERVAAGDGEYAAACAATVRIAGDHPGDLGIVASLLLRHVVLRPGEAVFLPAGGPHSYLHGTGVELLANSDNVVRAGLTPKHIDVPELLRLTDPAAAVPVIEPRPLGGGVSRLRLARAGVPAVPGRARRRGRDSPAGRRRAADRAVHRGRRAAARGLGRAQGWPGANRATCPRAGRRR